MIHRISCGALVLDAQERVALVRHVKPGVYDFLVAPGGGLDGEESLEDAARREAREEAGLEIGALRLVAVEHLIGRASGTCQVKHWFFGRLNEAGPALGGDDALRRREGIVEAGWFARADLVGKTVFPPILDDAFWREAARGFPDVIVMAPRVMSFE